MAGPAGSSSRWETLVRDGREVDLRLPERRFTDAEVEEQARQVRVCARARMCVLRAHALMRCAKVRAPTAGPRDSRGVQGGSGRHPCYVPPGRRAGLLLSPARQSSRRSRRPPASSAAFVRATHEQQATGGHEEGCRLTLLISSMSLNSSLPFSRRFVSQANSCLLKSIVRIEALATGGWLPCAKRWSQSAGRGCRPVCSSTSFTLLTPACLMFVFPLRVASPTAAAIPCVDWLGKGPACAYPMLGRSNVRARVSAWLIGVLVLADSQSSATLRGHGFGVALVPQRHNKRWSKKTPGQGGDPALSDTCAGAAAQAALAALRAVQSQFASRSSSLDVHGGQAAHEAAARLSTLAGATPRFARAGSQRLSKPSPGNQIAAPATAHLTGTSSTQCPSIRGCKWSKARSYCSRASPRWSHACCLHLSRQCLQF